MAKAKNGDAIVLKFDKEKETKNTVRYQEQERDGEPKLVGTLYLQKFVAKTLGETVTVTITG